MNKMWCRRPAHAPLDRVAFAIGEQHATADAAEREIKLVQTRLGDLDQLFKVLSPPAKFGIGQPFGWFPACRIEPVQRAGPSP
jgi:hypothetical protein